MKVWRRAVFIIGLIYPLMGHGTNQNRGVEEQRKYKIATLSSVLRTKLSEQSHTNGFSLRGHATYIYNDIYFDTASYALLKNKLSLRLRQRQLLDGRLEYAFQLKSEMDKPGAKRMEVEKEAWYLRQYRVRFNGKRIRLIKMLKQLFLSVNQSIEAKETPLCQACHIKAMEQSLIRWVKENLNDRYGPFRQLDKLKDDGLFTAKDLATLRPVLLGKSTRHRSHIFIDTSNTTEDLKGTKASKVPKADVPTLMKKKGLIWTMEASFDESLFFPFGEGNLAGFSLMEFEVENKYLPSNQGSHFLGLYQKGIIDAFGMQISQDSKYLQSANIFFVGAM